MARYTLTKSYSEIAETYGLFQNITGNADIEVTDDVNQSGIVIKPFQSVVIHQKVFARKIGIAGNSILAVLPFTDSVNASSSEEDSSTPTNDSSSFEAYDDLFSANPNFAKPPPHCPPLSVQETPSHYLVSVSKDSLNHQKKFVLQFEDKLKGR